MNERMKQYTPKIMHSTRQAFRKLMASLTAMTAFCGIMHGDNVSGKDECQFLYHKDGTVEAFPTAYLKDCQNDGTTITLTLANDSLISRSLADIDSISTVGPELPCFTSFKFNNKYNENLHTDVEADTLTEYMSFSIPAIGKSLTPSFKVSDENAIVYANGVEQSSKASRLRFDHDIVYTVALPGYTSLVRTTIQEEQDIEEIWSEEEWSQAEEEVPLTPSMLSVNQPSNNPDSEGLDKLLDNDYSTFFQSTWGSGIYEQKSENVCLDVALPYTLDKFAFYYCTRAITSYNPLKFNIYSSDNGRTWKFVTSLSTADGMPETYGNAEFFSQPIALDAPHRYLRFELAEAEHSKRLADGFVLYYMALSEFRIIKYQEPQLIKPRELIQEAQHLPAIYAYEMMPFYGRNYTVHIDWLTDHAEEVPRIDIDIDGGQMVSSKDYFLHARFRLDGKGVFDSMEDSIWIKGRGNSSWAGTWGKSPYRIKFDEKVKPFGLTKGKNWCLIANAQTGSMMANAIGMKAARMIGTQGACHIIPVNLYINGNYRGSYTFTEKVGFSNNNIDVDESTAYMLELDSYFDEMYRFNSSSFNLPVNIKQPDLTEEPFKQDNFFWYTTIQDEFDTFCKALYNRSNYEQYVDLDAFARFFMVNELINNMELGHPKSTYLYKEVIGDPESKFIFGPVWDLDWAFGYENSSTYYQRDATTSIFSKMTGQPGNNFFMAMFDNSELVRKAYYRVWVEFMRNYYTELKEYVQDYFDYANSSYITNSSVWGDGRNYEQSLNLISKWLDTRSAWILDNLEQFPLDDDNPILDLGDVNGDGVLSLADVVCFVGYLTGEVSVDFLRLQADLDKDGAITITDLVLTIDCVLKADAAAAKAALLRSAPAEMELVANGFEAHMGEECQLDVTLSPVEEADEEVIYTACQFIVTVPEGMSFVSAAPSDGLSATHLVTTEQLDDRHTRILLYSSSNQALQPGSTLRLTLCPENVVKEGRRFVTLGDASIATPDGDEHRLHSAAAQFQLGTGIDSQEATCSIEGGHMLTITALEPFTARILSADGKLIDTLDIQPGTTQHALPAGIYFVNNTKIIIY